MREIHVSNSRLGLEFHEYVYTAVWAQALHEDRIEKGQFPNMVPLTKPLDFRWGTLMPCSTGFIGSVVADSNRPGVDDNRGNQLIWLESGHNPGIGQHAPLALAVRFEELLRQGVNKDYADLARCRVEPGAVNAEPALQEQILAVRARERANGDRVAVVAKCRNSPRLSLPATTSAVQPKLRNSMPEHWSALGRYFAWGAHGQFWARKLPLISCPLSPRLRIPNGCP
jgi:hypothetical protein